MSSARKCPPSDIAPYCYRWQDRHRLRWVAWTKGWPDLASTCLKRGWSFTLIGHASMGHKIFIDLGIKYIKPVIWHVSIGRVYIPGDRGRFRAHDPEQVQILLNYAAERLGWQSANGQLPHIAKCGWGELKRVHEPPWDPEPYEE